VVPARRPIIEEINTEGWCY